MDRCPICGREAVDGVLRCSHSLDEWAELPLSIRVGGQPLSDLGLDGAVVIDAETGENLGPLEGFVWPVGKSLSEALRDALGPGRTIQIPAKPHNTGQPHKT